MRIVFSDVNCTNNDKPPMCVCVHLAALPPLQFDLKKI